MNTISKLISKEYKKHIKHQQWSLFRSNYFLNHDSNYLLCIRFIFYFIELCLLFFFITRLICAHNMLWNDHFLRNRLSYLSCYITILISKDPLCSRFLRTFFIEAKRSYSSLQTTCWFSFQFSFFSWIIKIIKEGGRWTLMIVDGRMRRVWFLSKLVA